MRLTVYRFISAMWLLLFCNFVNALTFTAEEENFLQQHPVIRVSNETDWPPLDFVAQGKPAGYSIDYMNLIADRLGIEFNYINGYSWAQLLEQGRQKQLDIIHSVRYSPQRASYLLFSDPIFELHPVIVSRRGEELDHLAALQYKTLAAVKGYQLSAQVAEKYPAIKVSYYSSPISGLKAVASGEADAYIDNLTAVDYLIKKHLLSNIGISGDVDLYDNQTDQLYVGVRNDWPIMQALINKAIADISEQELIQLRQKWLSKTEQFSAKLTPLLSNEENRWLAKQHYLTLCADPNWLPYDGITDQGAHTGLLADYMAVLSEKLDKPFKLMRTKSWQDTLELAKDGQCQLVSGIAASEQVKDYLNLSDIYLSSPVAIFGRPNASFSSLEELKGEILAVVRGYGNVSTIRSQYPEIKIRVVDDVTQGLYLVSGGKVDATLSTLFVAQFHMQKLGLANLKQYDFVPFSRDIRVGIGQQHPMLTNIINKALNSIPEQQHIALRKKWLTTDIQSSDNAAIDDLFNKQRHNALFSSSEKAWLNEKGVIRMCVDPHWPPFEWIDEHMEHKGIVADTLKAYEKRLGIPIELVPTRSWSQTLSKSKNRHCDIISAAARTPAREAYLSFGEPFMKLPVVIITRKQPYFIGNIGQLGDETMGVVAGYSLVEMIRKEYPDANIVEVANVEQGLKQVSGGELFAFVDTVASVSHYIQQGKLSNIKINGAAGIDWTIGVATRSDEPMLREIFDKVTLDIKSVEHDEIFNRWISIEYEQEASFKHLWPHALLISLVILMFIYWNRKLASLNTKVNAYLEIIDQHVLSLRISLNGQILSVSDAFCQLTGYQRSALTGTDLHLLYQNENSDRVKTSIKEAIDNASKWQGELALKNRDGSQLITDTYLSPIHRRGKLIAYSVIQQDITDKKRIENITRIDELTGLFNRRHFNEVFDKERLRAKRDNKLFAFMVIDVDNFKAFNDKYGHPKGDQVLIDIARALQSHLSRASDYVFRLGGEEFGVIISGASGVNEVTDIAYRLKESIEDLAITHPGNPPYDLVTISIGVKVLQADEAGDQLSVYEAADNALYRAKGKNRNCVLLADH